MSSVARQTVPMESTSAPIPPHWSEPGSYDSVTLAGPDAATYLQSQLSQELRDLEVGGSRWSFVLEPTGKVEALVRVSRVGDDEFRLDVDAGFGDALLARIERFKIRVRAVTSSTSATVPVSEAAEASRVAAGWPAMGREIVPGQTIPAETGLTSLAVSFTKGCYPGQELVERMDSRGAAAPRSLRRVTVSAGTEAGDPVHDDTGAVVGTVTSVAGTTALAYVKRGVDLGDPFTPPA